MGVIPKPKEDDGYWWCKGSKGPFIVKVGTWPAEINDGKQMVWLFDEENGFELSEFTFIEKVAPPSSAGD